MSNADLAARLEAQKLKLSPLLTGWAKSKTEWDEAVAIEVSPEDFLVGEKPSPGSKLKSFLDELQQNN